MPWTREKKYFASLLIWKQNHSKLSKQNSLDKFSFNLIIFEMRLLNLRINFYLLRTHLKKARDEIWPKRSERRNNTKNYQDEDKKSAINKN